MLWDNMIAEGEIDVMVPQLHSKGQVRLLIFKKVNLVHQVLLLSQINPYTNVMLHNTMRLI
jgi:hypothetical protein